MVTAENRTQKLFMDGNLQFFQMYLVMLRYKGRINFQHIPKITVI